MVNHGVSGACKTCKLRRKKCDEARPSCQRCVKARRICHGYQDSIDLRFRRYQGANNTCSSHFKSYDLSTHSLPSLPDKLSEYTIDAETEENALATFLNDYCLIVDHGVYLHGYLLGLEALLARAGPYSDLVQATKTVALASIGAKLGKVALVHKARIMYSEMLRSLQLLISNGGMATTAESLMTTVLLGMYEMITATEAHPSNHASHSCGIYAMLSTKSSPLDLLCSINNYGLSQTPFSKSFLKSGNIYGAPTSGTSKSLDFLLVKFRPLLGTAGPLLSSKLTLVEDLYRTMEAARILNEEYSQWSESQPKEWKPNTIGYINHSKLRSTQGLTWLHRRVDSYPDLYVATVWNIYRKTRLMLLSIIIRCRKRLDIRNACHDENLQVEGLANDMAASIPFHLSANVTEFMEQAEIGPDLTMIRGKSVGGLLLMHPLVIISNMSMIKPQLQSNMRECLAWIGTHMGIGQATVMSTSSTNFPNKALANGYSLIFAGMLFTIPENSA